MSAISSDDMQHMAKNTVSCFNDNMLISEHYIRRLNPLNITLSLDEHHRFV